MPDIFLSYSRDDQEAARRVALGLEAQGFSVWWDVTLRSGEDYDQATENALRQAKAVIVLWSKQSVASRWVRTEATIALQSKTLMPVMIEPCQRPIMFELTHTTDLSHWKGDASDKAWQTYVGDVGRFIRKEGSQPSASSTSHRVQGPAAAARWVRASVVVVRTHLSWLIAGVAVLAAATLGWLHWHVVPATEIRTDISTPAAIEPSMFALSPDGKQVVFVALGDDDVSRLWLRPLSSTTAQPLAGTEDASSPFWSPDSRSVAFFAKSQLQRLDLGSGAPRTLAPAPAGQGGAWNADGVILFSPSLQSAILRIAAAGDSVTPVTRLVENQVAQGVPFFLPDGRHFLFTAGGLSLETQGIYLGSLDSTEAKLLIPVGSRSVYMSGWLLWTQPGGNLVAQRLDLAQEKLTGEPVTLAEHVALNALSVSATGLVAFRAEARNEPRQLAWFDRAGQQLGALTGPDDTLQDTSLSPDGKQVVVSRTVQGNQDLWLLDGVRTTRLTFDPATEIGSVWSPDGGSIAFASSRSGVSDIYRKSANGSGNDELLVSSPQVKVPTDWSRDGQFLLYLSVDPQSQGDLWVQPLTGSKKPWAFLRTPFKEFFGQFSPDGKFVAYNSNESGRNEIYIRPFITSDESANAASGQWQVSTDGGIQPRWSHDGSELYYLDPQGRLMAVPIHITGTSVAPGAPQLLFATEVMGGGMQTTQYFQYTVSRNGRFLINTQADQGQSTAPITLIQNWQPPKE